MQWREEKGGKRMAGFSRENVAHHKPEGPWCEMHHHIMYARGSKLTVLTTAACCFCVFLFLRFLKVSWGGINYAYRTPTHCMPSVKGKWECKKEHDQNSKHGGKTKKER